jgi:hypothetical protein
VARSCHHYRIKDHVRLIVALKAGRYRYDGGGIAEHTDLDRTYGKV